ncbi:MAG: arginine--tRNA ligase, partial [Gammaproteobacteria bacterium]
MILVALEHEGISLPPNKAIQIEKTRDSQHGDYSSNVALIIAKSVDSNPRELADRIAGHLPDSELIDHAEVAGPGFINFFLNNNAYISTINEIIEAGGNYGCSDYGEGKPILIEFVSANPTGPLHIGHGRGVAYGAAVANLLEAIGYRVDREYYVNDTGRQMDILTLSIWLRYLEICDANIIFPEQAYQGEYIKAIARKLIAEKGDLLSKDTAALFSQHDTKADTEKYLDDLIDLAKSTLGENNYEFVLKLGLNEILNEIRTDLEDIGVTYDNWFSERSLTIDDQINKCIKQLDDNGYIYEKDGAQWFRSSKFGDEKDRVVIRDNNQTTYFASDIAYHKSKYDRGYTQIIDIWGADHHGYIARVKAALEALDKDTDALK